MKAGYSVTVFDRMEEAGGMLTYGIPAYRLPRAVIRKQVKVLEDAGVVFQLNTTLGKDVTVDELARQFRISTKTVSRWRRRGLVSRRFRFDGRRRVGFLQSSVTRFVTQNEERVRRAAGATGGHVDPGDGLFAVEGVGSPGASGDHRW